MKINLVNKRKKVAVIFIFFIASSAQSQRCPLNEDVKLRLAAAKLEFNNPDNYFCINPPDSYFSIHPEIYQSTIDIAMIKDDNERIMSCIAIIAYPKILHGLRNF
ncbi:hypothetical protein BXU11_03785 [Flavobacterium sp. LM5]|uniref:hypothetical protein n=1 Tax=Flavobacterium sp. LM5 TaxID=1938610 RepID=UPI000993F380|nr:hypothetical protein [Flavobacterium sp. LM5]OOV29059.1 hypothetical protein BXU11_03785 [Flavobacterium sp. LM5]